MTTREAPRPTMMSLRGMVCAAHPLAARAGLAMLERGGNAFDAAVAVAAALNVVEPFMSGLAGMGYATVRAASDPDVRVLDYVLPIPNSFPADRFNAREQMARGAQSVGLPGNLAGWHRLWSTYGALPFADLVAPAIALAEGGFALAEFGAAEIADQGPALAERTDLGPGWRATYPSRVEVGHIVRQPHLAASYRAIAADGIEVLYRGALGRRLVDCVQGLGGTLTLDDLAGAEPVWREPAEATFHGLVVRVPPPPSEAFQFLLTLRLLDGLFPGGFARNGPEHLDLVIRAVRLAAGVRIANNRPSQDELAHILSDAHVEGLRRRLLAGDGTRGQTEQWAPTPAPDPAHTTSFSIADRDGNLVCITQSLGSVFGSGVVVPDSGICLNNFLYWADVGEGSPNRARPGASLPICMAPSLATDAAGEPVLALGTPGSYGILQTQAQAYVQHVAYGLPLQAAIDAPRLRVWDGDRVEIEDRVPAETVVALARMGHTAAAFPAAWTWAVGGMQAIRRDPATGLLTGAADPRRDGAVAVL
jgi:gamma-glutamyltranspeptidase/glutathione hydrolase